MFTFFCSNRALPAAAFLSAAWLPRLAAMLVATVTPWGLVGCSEIALPAESTEQGLIYGKDSRRDPHAYADQEWAERALEFSAALVRTDQLDQSDPSNIRFRDQRTLGEENGLCPEVSFREQITGAGCSGTLIAPDLVLTAGHCLRTPCEQLQFVFNYAAGADGALLPITQDDVFACEQVLVREFDEDDITEPDFAVVQLSRTATGRTPADLDLEAKDAVPSSAIRVAGFPLGLPLKIADGEVRKTPAGADFFFSNLDAFPGNSGSAVFDATSMKAIGILVRGPVGTFLLDRERDCQVDLVCDDDKVCPGGSTFYVHQAIRALCAAQPQSGLCDCGDGFCSAEESTQSCPDDCGSSCGDGRCNGAEGASTCPDDCGTCGNGVCDEEPAACCQDCGCDGDSCAGAIPLQAVSQSIFGETNSVTNSFLTSCSNAQGGDRVYTFTLAEETDLNAIAFGSDTVLALRTDCADATSEIACNDDDFSTHLRFGGHIRQTLSPGEYTLIVETFSTGSGEYTLELGFNNPDAGCQSATPIDAGGGYTLQREAATENAHHGLCGGSRGNEHVYVFETTEAGPFQAHTSGHDSVLYLRPICDPHVAEFACNDDAPMRSDGASRIAVQNLPAGQYFLYADSYAGSAPYELTVNFCEEGDCCPDDPNKDIPGPCGCGRPDTDSDSDGTPDCIDACENDPAKAVPLQCGCGVPDRDSDGDGIADCLDRCPANSGKLLAGVCGCETPDTDSDGDGVADCIDECPTDSLKTIPGQCGCRFAEFDSDNDGVSDCLDACAADPDKDAPGVCGCGTPDTDQDGDGTPACLDRCDNDSLKVQPGSCGCGRLDLDGDADGTADCLDACPADRFKQTPGRCGCGVPEGSCPEPASSGAACNARGKGTFASTLPLCLLLTLLAFRSRRVGFPA